MTFKADPASIPAASFAFSGRSQRMVAASHKVNQLVSASSAAEGPRTAKLALERIPWARRGPPAGEARLFGGFRNGGQILVRAWRLLGDASCSSSPEPDNSERVSARPRA
jgi:hypothetical protein